jgi:tetratricopeptide (TPR) repeat protein
VGDLTGQCEVLNNIAGQQVFLGNYPAGVRLFGEAIVIARRLGDSGREATLLTNMGQVLFNEGKLDEARRAYDRACEIFRGLGVSGNISYPLVGRGDVLFEEADLPGAVQNYQAALDAAQGAGDKAQLAYAHGKLGLVAIQEDDLPRARQRLEQYLKLGKEAANAQWINDALFLLGTVELEQGAVDKASQLAQQADEGFQKTTLPEGEIEAKTLLARVALAKHDPPQARAQLAAAVKLLAGTPNVGLRLDFEIALAQSFSAEKRYSSAVAQLSKTIAQARHLQFIRLQYEARIAMAQAKNTAGQPAPARAEAASARKEADSRGLKLLARHAAL